MKVHYLKTWPVFFEAIWHGMKMAEIRKNDRDFHAGDVLILEEWDPSKVEDEAPTGRTITAEVSHLVRCFECRGIEDGYVLMTIWVTEQSDG